MDVDWDDEDEKTAIFGKGFEDSAKALLNSEPPVPLPAAGAPPPSLLSAPPPPPPFIPSAPPPPPPPLASSVPPALSSAAPQLRQPPPASMHAPMPSHRPSAMTPYASVAPAAQLPAQPANRNTMLAIVAALVGVVGLAIYLLLPKSGSLLVTVAGPGNKAVEKVDVLVDGKKRCSTSPCPIQDIAAGAHIISVTAEGYDTTAQQAIKVDQGEASIINLTLSRSNTQTGVRVTSKGTGLELIIDGKSAGSVPQEVRELSPGEHTVKLAGERYETFEQTVNLNAGQMLTLDPKLKVLKGVAHIKEGSNAFGARVVLVSGFERRPIPSLPISVDISTDKSYRLVATKNGFNQFEQPISFDDGEAEKTFVVEMNNNAPSSSGGGGAVSLGPSGGGRGPATGGAARGGNGTLNINSIPASNVVLDGKPMGSTPKVGVSVKPGPHTVVFIHPQLGRKVQQVSVEAGGRASALVRFN